MALPGGPEFLGRNTSEHRIEGGRYWKRVARLVDPEGGRVNPECKYDYQRLVNAGVELLHQERWGLQKFLPQARVHIVEDERMFGGLACWIEMEHVVGLTLSEDDQWTPRLKEQLVEFLSRVLGMAEQTKADGYLLMPDLLGGVIKSTDRFVNFMIDRQGRLRFVDLYPLVSPRTGAYRRNLKKAAQRLAWNDLEPTISRLIRLIPGSEIFS